MSYYNNNTSNSFLRFVQRRLFELAPLYDDYFIKHRYLIVCSNFKGRSYYIATANEGNFLHLTGVGTQLTPYEFFVKCRNKTLTFDDFFISNTDSKHNKNVVGEKLDNFKLLFSMFSTSSFIQEDFHSKSNSIYCLVATSDGYCTLGFTDEKIIKPKTLLDGNCLDMNNAYNIELVLRSDKRENKFNFIVAGDILALKKFYPLIEDELSSGLKDLCLS